MLTFHIWQPPEQQRAISIKKSMDLHGGRTIKSTDKKCFCLVPVLHNSPVMNPFASSRSEKRDRIRKTQTEEESMNKKQKERARVEQENNESVKTLTLLPPL